MSDNTDKPLDDSSSIEKIERVLDKLKSTLGPIQDGDVRLDSSSSVMDEIARLRKSITRMTCGLGLSSEVGCKTLECLQRLAELLPDPVLILDEFDQVVFANSIVKSVIGVSSGDLLGTSHNEFPILAPGDVGRFVQAITAARSGERPDAFTLTGRRVDGSAIHLEYYIDVLSPNSPDTPVVVVARQVSEQVQAMQALSESRRRLETLMGNLPGMAYRCLNNPDWTMEFVSRGAKSLTGYDPQQLIDSKELSYADLIHPDDRTMVWEVVQTGVQHGRAFQMQYRIRTADGRERWVWEQGRGVLDESGELAALEGFITDVSDRKFAEEALRRSEDNFRQLVEDLNDAIFELDLKGELVYISPVIEEVTGYAVKEIIGRSFKDFVHPDDHQRLDIAVKEILNGVRHPREYRIKTRKGGWLWVRSYSRRFLHAGKPAGIRGVLTNITDQKTAESALLESRVLMSNTLSSSPVAAFIIDREHRVTHWNRACEVLTGIKASEIVGTTNQWSAFYPAKRPVFADLIVDGCNEEEITAHYSDKFRPSLLISGAYEAEDHFPSLGKVGGRWLFFTAAPIKDSEGNVVGAVETLQDVTERRQAEERLSERERSLASIFRAAPIGIGLVRERVLVRVNRTLCEMLGYEPRELIGCSARMLYPTQEEFDRVGKEKYDEIARKGTGTVVTRWICKDGTTLDVLLSSSPLEIGDLSQGVTFTAADITQRLKAEADLRESEERYRRMIDTANEGIWTIDAGMRTMYVNQKMCDLLGYTPEEMLGKPILGFVAADDQIDHEAQMIARREGQRGRYERQFVHRDGSVRWMVVSASPLWEKNGAFAGSMAMLTDITERKRAEQALRDSEERYRGLFETARDGIFLLDGSKIVDCNPRSLEMFQCTRSELISNSPLELSPAWQPYSISSQQSGVQKIEAALGGEPQWFEWRHRRPDGTEFDVEVSLSRLDLAGGHLLLAFMRDITDRKRAEDALRSSEERFRALFESALDLISIKDKNFRYVACNPIMQETFGLSTGDMIGITDEKLFPSDDVEQIRKTDERVLHGEIFEGEEQLTVGDEVRRFHVVKVPMRTSDGTVVGICNIARDITEKARIDEELARADKLESIGLLAGGIAHDFNNILAAILGNVSLAKMDVEKNSELFDLLSNAEKATERARDLTQQLLTFSKGGSPVKRSASIRNIVSDCVSFSLRGSNVRSHLSVPDDLWNAKVDVGQISQVIHNLIINADQAMPDGGTLKVSAQNLVVNEMDQLPLRNGKYVQIHVVDQGVGIEEANLSRIFDPFFTTKVRGNGLGLATSFSIIKKHDGHISCESQVGEGTHFRIYLPATEESIAALPESQISAPRQGCRVLVVDDESDVRDVVSRILSKAGYRVDGVFDGHEALVSYVKSIEADDPYDAIIMDLTIPGGMGGQEAVKKLLDIDSGAQVIVASGYSNDPVMSDYESFGFTGRVVKPFDQQELLRVLGEVLANVDVVPDPHDHD